jgi:hypothetical protein
MAKKNVGFDIREGHRQALMLHASLMTVGLLACAFANRMFSPDRFWAQYVALAWGALFVAHLVRFSRRTLASMTSKGRQEALASREAKGDAKAA